MNDKRGFERIAAQWLDEGSDVTPPDVIDAVLLAVRNTPQERDFRLSWRTSPMKSLAYAVAAVAAIVIVAVGANALNGGNVGGPGSTDGSSAPSPSQTALTGCTPEAISASGETLSVSSCLSRPDGQQVPVAFRLTTTYAAAWTNGNERVGQGFLYFRPYGFGIQAGGHVAISVGGPTTVDAWLALITGEETYTVTEPQPISLGGAEGYVFDVSIAPGFTSFDAPPLFEDPEQLWDQSNEFLHRVWLVDHEGQAVMFVTGPVGVMADVSGDKSEWAVALGWVLRTIEWIP